MDATRLWRLEGVVKPYAWGSKTAIPELLGREPTGEPQAELWLGAHPGGPARAFLPEAGSIGLDEWIGRDPVEVLGADVARRHGGELPFLLKVLAADEPLSIQAHPSAERARAGFERENAAGIPLDAPHRSYRDPNAKPELICALSEFRALCRFRDPIEIERDVSALGVAGLDPALSSLGEAPGGTGLRAFFTRWMTLDAARRRRLVAEVAAAVDALAVPEPSHREVARLARRHPGDAGVLAPLFLNLVTLAPGEAMFLPAGELHGYLGGVAVEVMASSDNVLRGGLTRKHVDVEELLATLSYQSGRVEILRAAPVGNGEARYRAPAGEFSLSVIRTGPDGGWRATERRGVEILLCTAGSARVRDARGRTLQLERGASALAPARAGSYAIEGEATLFKVGCITR